MVVQNPFLTWKKKEENKEEKKKKKEEEKQRKDQEKIRRAKEREAKYKERRVHRATERQEKKDKQTQSKKRPADGDTGNTSEVEETTRRPLRKREKHILIPPEFINESVCCVCMGSYDEDAGTGRTWFKCQCGRWIHSDCVLPASSSNDKLCPIC